MKLNSVDSFLLYKIVRYVNNRYKLFLKPLNLHVFFFMCRGTRTLKVAIIAAFLFLAVQVLVFYAELSDTQIIQRSLPLKGQWWINDKKTLTGQYCSNR